MDCGLRMLDVKLIREQPDKVRENLARRHEPEKLQLLDHVIEADKKWRELTNQVNQLRRKRNQISSQIGQVIKDGGDASDLRKEAAEIPSQLREVESQMNHYQDRLQYHMALTTQRTSSSRHGEKDPRLTLNQKVTQRLLTN